MLRLAALFFAPLLLFAASINGDWTGIVQVNGVRTLVHVHLARRGADLVGQIGREGESSQVPIRHGRIEGSIVYFQASNDQTKTPMQFRLTLIGHRLEGDMTGQIEQGKITGQVRLTREGH